jgi:hypothetical protein
MQIRRQSDPEFEAVRFTGSFDTLISWLANQTDFMYAVVAKDLSIIVNKANGNAFTLISGDYIRIREDATLDKISASNFAVTWEPVIPAP